MKLRIFILMFFLVAFGGILYANATKNTVPEVNEAKDPNVIIYDVEEIESNDLSFIINYNINESELRTSYSYVSDWTIWSLFLRDYELKYPAEMLIKYDNYGLYCEDSNYKYRIFDSNGKAVYLRDYIKKDEEYYTARVQLNEMLIESPTGEEIYSYETGIIFGDWLQSKYCPAEAFILIDGHIYCAADLSFYQLVDSRGQAVHRMSQILESESYRFELCAAETIKFSGHVFDEDDKPIPFSIEAPYIPGIKWRDWIDSVGMDYLQLDRISNNNIYVLYDYYIYVITSSVDVGERKNVDIRDYIVPGVEYYLDYYSVA